MDNLKVDLGERSYQIIVAQGAIEEAGHLLSEFNFSKRCLVVTNSIVGGYYGDAVLASLRTAGFQPFLYNIPDGEEAKSVEQARVLWDEAVLRGLDRHAPMIALGGGVVGDLTGFVAATYMRGVPLIQVPTTLLAQVDSSVGGKVAVNHPAGKNLIGAFYQPRLVLADLESLATLPHRELLAGLAEVIKYGVIWDAEFFSFLEGNLSELLNRNRQKLQQAILRSCEIKAEVVARDEREDNLRAILNFGHTFGHAVETLTAYQGVRHGEAVAMGMAEVSRVAARMGILGQRDCLRVIELLSRFGLPTELPEGLSKSAMLQTMLRDKKNKQGKITLVLPQEIGKAEVKSGIAVEELDKYWVQGD